MLRRLLHFKQEIILFVVTSLLLLSGLNKAEVNIMEARNFISAREMVQNKEYLLTTLNGEPRYQKPPLPTWLTAASGRIFGFDSLNTLRLPVAAVTFLLVFAFYYCSKLLGLSSKHRFNNALILITSFYIFFAGRDNQWDMYTHSFMLVSIYFLWKVFQNESGGLRNSFFAGLFLGFSILSKGPVSFYALFLPFLISYGIVYRIPFREKRLYLLNMLLSGLTIGLSWYIYVRLKDPEYFRIITAHEASNWRSYEIKPFYYYWNFFIQSGLWAIPSLTALFYPYLKSRVSNQKAYRFAILWTLFTVIFLSLIPEKKVRYLVPSLIPLALTTGFYIEYLINHFNKSMAQREKIWICFSFGIIALIGFIYPFVLMFLLKEGIKEYILLYVVSSILVYICTFLIVNGLIGKNFKKVFYAMIALFTVVVIAVFPMSEKLFLNPDYAPASKVRVIEKQYNVKTYRLSDVAPEIVWDFGKPISLIPQNNSRICLPREKQFGLVVDAGDSTAMKTRLSQYKIERLGRINMNYRKGKKSRLIKDYYLLSKNCSSIKN
ncbi:MAG: ArnT family glycosyltransferase [Vulcanibacillus sp.]|jgi:4-amino-4-deoxy-L-arabinose transferase-like glycosyltransferase